MKSLRVIVIAMLVSVAFAAQTSAEKFKVDPNKNKVYISVTQASQVPGLAEAMHRSLNPNFLMKDKQSYTITFYWLNIIYVVSGNYEQWADFFWPKVVMPGTTRTDIRID